MATPLGLALTLVSVGLEGVHRWTHLGSLRINMAEVLLPLAVVALAGLGRDHRWPWLAAAVTLGLLVAQPDASQATALAGAMAVMLVAGRLGRRVQWGLVALAGVAVVAAWSRPDPLQPVPEVEQILSLAWTLSPLAAAGAAGLLLGAALTPWLARTQRAAAASGLGVYFLLSAVTPALGAFPVPLIGMATSPILGFWLGVGLLAAPGAKRSTP